VTRVIWALLIFVGVPLWLCALGISALVFRNRSLRKRHGDIPVRVLRPGKKRWTRGHAVWVSDVFAWRGSPAAWKEDLERIVSARIQEATTEDLRGLHRMGDDAVVVTLKTDDDTVLHAASSGVHQSALLGPFAPHTEPAGLPE
jgi:hypothetical protein